MPRKAIVRKARFISPEEMAFEPLADYSHLNFKRRSSRNLVELDSDLAAFFKSADAVNNALRKLMEAMPSGSVKQKRSA